ncbi:unnamed protein product [Rhizoctonia solani]|uniref:Elongation factor 1 alpha-like protein n=1 Tax=Rhizoctonia solani TaxID=456999 RepID=A0A8H2X2W0_9AGAM|nr:unnamed protein product [Rhizoctonia solani]
MSRHRDVRNMNIHDELAEDDVSDTHDEDDDMTDEQKGFNLMLTVKLLGDKNASGIDDKQIKDALWDSYFDTEGTISWLLDQRAKQAAAAAKKVPDQDEAIQAPLSALQRLALQRRQAGSSPANNATDKPGGLVGLAKGFSKKSPNVGIPPATGASSSFVSPSTNLPPKTSKLSALAQKSASLRANSATKPSIQSNTSTDTPLSKLALRIKAQKDAQEAAAPSQTETDAHKPESNVQPSKPEFEHFAAHKAHAPPGLKKVNPNKQPLSNKSTSKTAPLQHPSGSKKQLEQEPTARNADTLEMDMAGLNIIKPQDSQPEEEAPPKISIARERILEEARKEATSGDADGRKRLSLVVIGHVDAGKSTLMGRLLYECGQVEEKRRRDHERASEKAGKASFSWAWELDAGTEERERGITMDIAQSVLPTEHRIISILDAPGHKDFVPNMISGASQADCALLVVDAATGAFEKGFEGGGQTREHIGVVRSLGVRNIVVAVNKMDMVDYRKSRFDEIQVALLPFLIQAGFNTSRVAFVPCAGVSGVNLTKSEEPALQSWWNGQPIVDYLDRLEPPVRDFDTPLRIPISNVFKGVTSSGIGISGRISGGIVQVGERVRVIPGDETAAIKSIEKDDVNVQWAAAGSNVTIYLTSIDPIHLSIGSVLCSPSDIVPLASSFNAQIIVFDIQLPIIGGSSVELFHHSREVPASVSKLIETVDRATGAVIKRNPR